MQYGLLTGKQTDGAEARLAVLIAWQTCPDVSFWLKWHSAAPSTLL